MSKASRQLITLLVIIALTGGLAFVYFNFGREEQAQEAETPAPQNIRLIDRAVSDIERVVFTSTDSLLSSSRTIFTIETATDNGRSIWVYTSDRYNREVALDQQAVNSLMRDISSLNAVDIVMEEAEGIFEFGIGQVVAAAHFTDGSQEVIRLGNLTPDRTRFYMMLNEDPALYLISIGPGERLSRQIEDLVDMALPIVNPMQLTHMYLRERGREPLEFGFTGTQAEFEQQFSQFGGVQLSMLTPYFGRDFHFSSFQYFALQNFEGFQPSKVVELFPENFARFGLEDPLLEFIMADLSGYFHIIIGDNHDAEYVYMMYGGRPHVFLVQRSYIEDLLGLNPFNFIDRFVALIGIVEVDRITLQSAARGNHELIVNNYLDESNRERIAPVVDGQEVDDRAFRNVYQILIGLSYEHQIELQEEPGVPDIVITYHFIDESEPPLVVELFVYDANFYRVRQQPNPVQFVTSRLAVEMLFTNVAALTE